MVFEVAANLLLIYWSTISMNAAIYCRSSIDSWTRGASSRHTFYKSATLDLRLYPFPVPLWIGGWVGLRAQ